MKPIDLGMSYGDSGGPLPVEVKQDEKHYPAFHYEGTEDLGIPHEGVMTIRYKKTSSSVSEHDDRPPRYSCTVEVRKIESIEGAEDAPTKNYSQDAESALDALMEKKLKQKGY